MEPSEYSSRIIRPSATPSPVKFPLSCNPLLDVCGCFVGADALAKHPQTSIITWGHRRRPRRFCAVSAQKTGRLGRNQAMRVENELFGRPLVKVPVTLRSILQRNDGSIDGLGDL